MANNRGDNGRVRQNSNHQRTYPRVRTATEEASCNTSHGRSSTILSTDSRIHEDADTFLEARDTSLLLGTGSMFGDHDSAGQSTHSPNATTSTSGHGVSAHYAVTPSDRARRSKHSSSADIRYTPSNPNPKRRGSDLDSDRTSQSFRCHTSRSSAKPGSSTRPRSNVTSAQSEQNQIIEGEEHVVASPVGLSENEGDAYAKADDNDEGRTDTDEMIKNKHNVGKGHSSGPRKR